MSSTYQHTHNPYLPTVAHIVERIDESETIFTLRLRFAEGDLANRYSFAPGQFNMVYLFGVGEVPISIVSDPEDDKLIDHTIRVVGRITRGLAQLKAGDTVGIRGPFGRGWPLYEAEGKDIVVLTGGLGCAPVVSVIRYIQRRREKYGNLTIMQGVKHSADLIWRKQYEHWAQQERTQVLLAADAIGSEWPWHKGYVTQLIDQAHFDPYHCEVMMCGPELMMASGAEQLLARGVGEHSIWLSMERNMQCAIGICGHCQYGPHFICKNGPVFSYNEIKSYIAKPGY